MNFPTPNSYNKKNTSWLNRRKRIKFATKKRLNLTIFQLTTKYYCQLQHLPQFLKSNDSDHNQIQMSYSMFKPIGREQLWFFNIPTQLLAFFMGSYEMGFFAPIKSKTNKDSDEKEKSNPVTDMSQLSKFLALNISNNIVTPIKLTSSNLSWVRESQ